MRSKIWPWLFLCALSLPYRTFGESFSREDWIYTVETSHTNYWGIQWGMNSLLVPYRVLQRAKDAAWSRYFNNFKRSDDKSGPLGVGARLVLGFGGDFGLFFGTLNLHHTMGHDAAARELSLDWGLGDGVPKRTKQVLPKFFGGRELGVQERQPGGGADAQTQINVQPMQAEMQFSYDQAKTIMGKDAPNSTELANFILYRLRFHMDWFGEKGTVVQDYVTFISSDNPSSELRQKFGHGKSEFSTDYTNYLVQLNTRRYGVQNVSDYKVKMDDLRRAQTLQFLDPVFLVGVWQYGKDYLVRGRNTSSLPMIPLGKGIRYLPGFRTYLSPFGLDTYQDNYFRRKGLLANLFWSRGDNKYEKRSGFGIDIEGISLPVHITLGLLAEYSAQPSLSRIVNRNPLSAPEVGQRHAVKNFAAELKIPVLRISGSDDPERFFLYGRGGHKTTGWLPGEYLKGSDYLQIGAGLRL